MFDTGTGYMLQEIYYIFSGLYYRKKIKLGKSPQFRLGAVIINGGYINIGNNVTMGKNLIMAVYPEHCGRENPVKNNGSGIRIGNRTHGYHDMTIYCADGVEIGDDVLFGSNILITDNNHGMDPDAGEYINQPLTTKPVKIGNGCWIGERVCILAGSNIGERSVIAAGSVVTGGTIPPYSLVAGVPAKVIKRWDAENRMWIKV